MYQHKTRTMELDFRIKMNEKLYLRDPEQSDLGRRIVKQGLELINRLGFEDFTFKKLAIEIDTTEAGIYRYFENKHRLLVYLIEWYWSYMAYKTVFYVNNIKSPEEKLKRIIQLLITFEGSGNGGAFLNERQAQQLVMWEGSKAYLTRHITEDNKDRLFKPYKDLCARFADIILEYNPKYKFAHSLASTILEMSHSQKFFMKNLPSLTDFAQEKDDKKLGMFLETLLFAAIKPVKTK